jgi:MoaA/NifB/PqqE/SkfB family radical SAM enzyme
MGSKDEGYMKLLINPTWRCQLSCPYCLLPHIKINRKATEHAWWEWANAIVKHAPVGSVVDIAGGDPLLWDGLELFCAALFEHGIRWAITTNALHTAAVDKLLTLHPGGCQLINISDHPGNLVADANIARLRSAYPVVMNRVDHPDAGKRNVQVSSLIPYQSYREGTEIDHVVRYCDSGIHHWVIDVAGDAFICNVAMATGRKPLGNIFRDEVIPKPTERFICDWGCSSCYTSVPGCWDVHQEVIR